MVMENTHFVAECSARSHGRTTANSDADSTTRRSWTCISHTDDSVSTHHHHHHHHHFMRPSRPHYGSCPSVRPSVRPCVCRLRAPNSKTRMRRNTDIGMNAPRGWSSRCSNFQFKKVSL